MYKTLITILIVSHITKHRAIDPTEIWILSCMYVCICMKMMSLIIYIAASLINKHIHIHKYKKKNQN